MPQQASKPLRVCLSCYDVLAAEASGLTTPDGKLLRISYILFIIQYEIASGNNMLDKHFINPYAAGG